MTGRLARLIGMVLFLCLCGTSVARAQGSAAGQAADPSAGQTVDGEYGHWLPPNIAKGGYAHQVDLLINVLHWFMAILFVTWGVFFVYCLIKFRARPGHRADVRMPKARIAKWGEVGVAVFEAFLLIGVSIPAWASIKNDLPAEDADAVRLRVVAEQFQWNFHYPGKDGIFGRTAPELINTATNPLGLDASDPHGADDVFSLELHIPVDRVIVAYVTSKDVIHSFSISVLRVKQDAIPGMRIPTWFQAGKTGTYEVACAQLCGNNHYSMRALLVVQSQADFDAWFEEMSAPPEEFDEDEL